MRPFFAVLFVALLATVACSVTQDKGKVKDKPKDKAKAKGAGDDHINELSLDVSALVTLHQFQATDEQLSALAKLAAPSKQRREQAKASARYVNTLTELRAAYIKGDEKQIEELEALVEEYYDKDKPELDDGVKPTGEACKNAPAAVKLFTARQMMNYLSERENVADAVPRLLQVVADGDQRKEKRWATLRDEAAEEIAALLTGAHQKAFNDAVKKLTAILDAAHHRKVGDPQTRKEIDQLVSELTGEQGAFDLLRNVVERDTAELLSNPRLTLVIKARLAR